MKELEKNYEAKKYEDDIYAQWEKDGFFKPEKQDSPRGKFFIVLPPPNVTGVLHMGHAAMLAIEDVLARYHRMKGEKTLWLPGTDHAAIATQTKVEKNLIEGGMKDPRTELGREKFLAEVEKFAQASHDTIVNQSKKMGSSLDWGREAYTFDETRNSAVKKVFKMMFDDGLIERGFRIVNWCPRCHSTLADDEVEYKEQQAKLYFFKYDSDFPFAISTTRPETKLGDTAVAVNPEDERYKKYIGQTIEVKNFAGGTDLKLKIIGDEAVDMNFGTGAVGVTPAHSMVDYEMAMKNDLPIIKVIDEDGKMTKVVGEVYAGLTVLEAREKVVEKLREAGLLMNEEEMINNLSICYRCSHAIEPLPSEQWFVKVNKKFKIKGNGLQGFKEGDEATLKEVMLNAVKSEQIKIVPERFEKTYYNWIKNLRDWCISRQIWYGHRIPVYYCDACGEVVTSVDEITTCPKCGKAVRQDPDTLDTWFSSGLWTFSTLAHKPEDIRLENGKLFIDSDDFKNFHPVSVMETGYDILFFWVARMILMTTYALGEIPFEKVYLHGLVRDDQGRKMSKSLGNVMNPLDMIDQYGTDATRLSLLLGTGPGNDMKLSEEKVAGFKNFTNKLWNISRFMLINIPEPKIDMSVPTPKTIADEWILNNLQTIILESNKNLDNFNFSYTGEILQNFTWNILADWYLEVAKVEGDKSEILNYILNTVLKLWHPFMPFVTEVIWQEVYGTDKILMSETWPNSDIKIYKGGNEFGVIKNIITLIRKMRSEAGIDWSKKIDVIISTEGNKYFYEQNLEIIKRLGTSINNLKITEKMAKPDGWSGFVSGTAEIYLDFSGAVDKDKEIEKIIKEIEEKESYEKSLTIKLTNKEFTDNAPKAVVDKEKEKLSETQVILDKLQAQLKTLS